MDRKKVCDYLRLIPVVLLAFCLAHCGLSGTGDGNGEPDDGDIYKLEGLNFSPYMDGQDPNLGSPISESQLRERMQIIAPYAKWIRTFGLQDGLGLSGKIAHELGLKIAVGAWLAPDQDANAKEIEDLIAVAKANEADMLVVGSEVLLRGDITEQELIAHMNHVKSAVPGIPVTTADVYGELFGHPNVMDACDVIFVNYFPYWEGISVEKAMANIHTRHLEAVARAKGKEVYVSESGWPSDGDRIGDGVPSLANAASFFVNFISWARAEHVKYFYFEAFDETWKAAREGPQGAHWGIWDKDGKMKAGMKDVFDGETVANNWKCEQMPGGPGTPEIQLTDIPPYNSFDDLRGQVWHVWPEEHRVVVYIHIDGWGWWTKPSWTNPLVLIDLEGKWTCDITTGGIDETATKVAAFLFPIGYDPPLASGQMELPAELIENAIAWVEADKPPSDSPSCPTALPSLVSFH